MKHVYALWHSTLVLFVLCPMVLFADETCDDALTEGKQKYNAGNYQKAKELFRFVQSECGNSYGDAQSWINKCNEALTPRLSVSNSNLSFSASGGTQSITVSSNRSWSLGATNSQMFSVSYYGNTITVRCYENTGTSSRNDYFIVRATDGSKSVRVNVSQNAAQTSLSVSKTSISCSASGTTEYITVYSSTAWQIEYASGTMYSVTRNGNTLTVKINANSTSTSRNDYFNVKTSDGRFTQKISLSQTGRITVQNSTPTSYQITQMRARINSVRVEHNVMKDGVRGMRIHVNFDCYNMRNFKGWCIAWFYNADGTSMKNYSASAYANSNYNVGVWDTFVPGYDSTGYSDYVLFIPNSAIPGRGQNLYFQVCIQEYSTGKSLCASSYQYFSLR